MELKSFEETNTEVKIQDIPEAKVFIKNDTVFVNEKEYKLVTNYRNGFTCESFQDRYTKLLDKYHFIVGDWGHDQLRLKGFYANHQEQVDAEYKISALQDYLREYCAFGCAYFVLESQFEPNNREFLQKKRSTKTRSQYTTYKSNNQQRQNKKNQNKDKKTYERKHHFVIHK